MHQRESLGFPQFTLLTYFLQIVNIYVSWCFTEAEADRGRGRQRQIDLLDKLTHIIIEAKETYNKLL